MRLVSDVVFIAEHFVHGIFHFCFEWILVEEFVQENVLLDYSTGFTSFLWRSDGLL